MFPELELREGWVTVICLLLMVLCVAWSIQAADWADGLSILQGTALVGGVLGIVLAKSRVPNRLAHLLSLLAGWTWSFYLTSQVLMRAINVPGPMAVVELEERFYDLFLIPFYEGMTADNHVFVLLLGFLLWVLAYFCAWAVFRWQRVWWSVILCGVAILLNMSYTTENLTVYVILFLLFALLLVVRASLAFYEQEWRAAHIGYSPELISAFLRAGLAFSAVVILIAWAAPVALASRPLQPFWDKIGQPWREFQERSARVFRDLNYQNEPPLVSLGDRRMWFGGPVNLSDTPVADVDASTGRYWRVVVFHEYIGDGWLSNDPDIILIGANEQDLAFPEFDLRFEITQTVILLRDWQVSDSLIAAGQPLRADLPLRAAVTFVTQEEDLVRAPDSSPFPSAPGDPSALYARRPLQVGESYQVLSSLTEADAESLRQAGIAYPDWVRPRYLQLPESLPQRVRLLAAALTEGEETPYDKAKAIETYLRGIPYSEEIEGPGVGQDGVDYFLFDAETGYCDYYASAMVVMLRSVGVPARYVRGYSQGETEEGVFLLRESDGHAWPEVFFPGYGWVEFEPTGGEPPLLRPESLEPESSAPAGSNRPAPRQDLRPLMDEEGLDTLGQEEEGPPTPWWRKVGVGGWSAVGVGGLGLAGGIFLTIRRRRDIEGLSVAERVYEDLVSWARHLLRIEPLAHQTPHEYASIVAQQVPRGQKAVEQIAGFYVEERFGAKEVPGAPAEVAWRQAWPALWHRWLERRVDRVRRFWWLFVPPKEFPES